MTTAAIVFGAIFLALLVIGILTFIMGNINKEDLLLPFVFILIGAIGLFLCLTI